MATATLVHPSLSSLEEVSAALPVPETVSEYAVHISDPTPLQETVGKVNNLRSITYQGFCNLVAFFAPTDPSVPFTSHHLRSIFQGNGDSNSKFRGEAFHPHHKCAHCYSDQKPDIAVTYAWDTDLRTSMPKFFEEIEKIVQADLAQDGGEGFHKTFNQMTFWIDIFFNDQNKKSLMEDLEEAQKIYSDAPYHVVLLSKGPLARGWCLFEIAARTYAVMTEFKLSASEIGKIIAGSSSGTYHSTRQWRDVSHSFVKSKKLSQFIVGEGVTDLNSDLIRFCTTDAIDNMKTSMPEDKVMIQKRLETLVESKKRFNSLIRGFAATAVQHLEAAKMSGYRLAAEHGKAEAQNELGLCQGLGGLPKDAKEAVACYRLSADQGWAAGQYNLGRCYAYGLGVARDGAEGERLLRLAADQDHTDAKAELERNMFAADPEALYKQGLRHELGDGVSRDYAKARRLYELAGPMGSVSAQAGLGWLHWKGRGGLRKNDEEAERLCRLAAESGDARGRYCLARVLLDGYSEQRMEVAAELLWQAAEEGHAPAQLYLGMWHARIGPFRTEYSETVIDDEWDDGGVPANIVMGRRLVGAAASGGHEGARRLLTLGLACPLLCTFSQAWCCPPWLHFWDGCNERWNGCGDPLFDRSQEDGCWPLYCPWFVCFGAPYALICYPAYYLLPECCVRCVGDPTEGIHIDGADDERNDHEQLVEGGREVQETPPFAERWSDDDSDRGRGGMTERA